VTGTNDGIWDWEFGTNKVYYSPRLKQLIGVSEQDDFSPVPDTFWQLMHPEDVPRIERAVQRHARNREPYDVEYRIRMPDGRYRWFRARAQAVWDKKGDVQRMAGSISDIHQRKLAEESLERARVAELHAHEEFAQLLLAAQEQERLRLANELHDSVGQNLSLIKSRALLVLQRDEVSVDTALHIQALSDLTAEVIADVRRVAQNLRPLHIEQLGLTDALETLIARVAESSDLHFDKRLENVDDAIMGAAATHVFRIVQEALNNILKHARARSCRILLERDVHCARLIVNDDGVGFTSDANTPHGLGLASISERARILRARLEVNSRPGIGTEIKIEIPFAASVEPANEAAAPTGTS
jgi:two-component system sensor histidine kinase UhpB